MALSKKRHFVAMAIGLAIGLGTFILLKIINSPVLHSITIAIALVLSMTLFSAIGRKRP